MISRRRSSGYSVPCVYCGEGASFPSLESLKKHLISSHENLVTGKKAGIQKDQRSVKRLCPQIPSTEVQRSTTTERVQYGASSNTTSPAVLSSKIHTETDSLYSATHTIPHLSERKFKRLNDNLERKDKEIEDLTKQNDTLKADLVSIDEEQNQLRHRWRKEAEDSIRYLKTNYEDVLAQNQMLEKQLHESENEKIRTRNENDKLVKDHTDLQIKTAAEKRNTQQRHEVGDRPWVAGKKLNTEKETNKILSDNNEFLKIEKENLLAAVVSKDNTIKELQLSIQTAQDDLSNERTKQNDLNEERISMKGKLALIGESVFQTETERKVQKSNIANLTAKVKSLETSKYELTKQLAVHQSTVEEFTDEISSLKEDKNRLIKNLHNADNAFNKLSQRMTSTSQSNIQLPATSSFITDETKTSLDQILNVVKQISERDSHSTKQEVNHLSIELHRVNLLLLEEKANVKQLNANLIEMEKYMNANEAEDETKTNKQITELNILRSKHQKCKENEKIRKQVKSEKKILMRKLREEQKQHQLLNVLFNSLKDEIQHKNDVMKDMQKERNLMEAENKRLSTTIVNTRQDISKSDLTLEKYKRESVYLLEKLNNATEDVETLKNKNKSLEMKLTNLDVIETNLNQLQVSIQKLTENTQLPSESTKVDIEPLVQNNIQLTNEIIKLQRSLHDEAQHVEKLKEKVSELQVLKENHDSDIEQLMNEKAFRSHLTNESREADLSSNESTIENLMLEREILSSRVLILEGIREEMEILRGENNKLKEESYNMNQFIKSNISGSFRGLWESDEETSSVGKLAIEGSTNSSEDAVNLEDKQFFESVKTLDTLCEEDRLKLKDMLSTPEFQEFLSTSNVVINLQYKSDDSISSSDLATPANLSEERFESEHTVNHIYSATNSHQSLSADEVMENQEESEDEENERTINYMQLKTEDVPAIDLKSLKKISESNIRSSNSAIQNKQQDKVDYGKVLHEFEKVMRSQKSIFNQTLVDRTESGKAKQVKFSELVAEVISSNNSTEKDIISDDSLYKSYFQDALQKNYPEITQYDNDDGDDDQDSDISCDASMNELLLKQKSSSSVSSNDKLASSERKIQISSTLENTPMAKTDSSSLNPNNNPKCETSLLSDDSSNLNRGNSTTTQYAALSPRAFSTDNNGLFKGMDILPLIHEMTSSLNLKNNYKSETSLQNSDSSNLSIGNSTTIPYAAASPRASSSDKDGFFKEMDILPLIHEMTSSLKQNYDPKSANDLQNEDSPNSSSGSTATTRNTAASPRRFSSDNNGLFKGVGILPFINEGDVLRSSLTTPLLFSPSSNGTTCSSTRRISVDSDKPSCYGSAISWSHSDSSTDYPSKRRFSRDSDNQSDYESNTYSSSSTNSFGENTKRCLSGSDKATDYQLDLSSQLNSEIPSTIPTTGHSARPFSVDNDSLIKRIGVLPLISQQDIVGENIINSFDHSSLEKKESAINALHVLQSFIRKADEIKPTSNNEEIDNNINENSNLHDVPGITTKSLLPWKENKDIYATDNLMNTVIPEDEQSEDNIDVDSAELSGVGVLNNTSIFNNSLLFINDDNARSTQLKSQLTGNTRKYFASSPNETLPCKSQLFH